MRRLLPLLLGTILAAPLPARAQASIQLDLRAGIAKPFGEITSGAKLGDEISWAFPLQGDLQFRFLRSFSAGVYARWTPALVDPAVAGGCDAAGIACSASSLAFGGLAEYRFSDRPEGGAWVGVLLGWEQLRTTQSLGGAKATETDSGVEFGMEGGYDFELGGFSLGPWASLMFGQFGQRRLETGGSTTSGAIASTSLHGWFQVGVRAALLF